MPVEVEIHDVYSLVPLVMKKGFSLCVFSMGLKLSNLLSLLVFFHVSEPWQFSIPVGHFMTATAKPNTATNASVTGVANANTENPTDHPVRPCSHIESPWKPPQRLE